MPMNWPAISMKKYFLAWLLLGLSVVAPAQDIRVGFTREQRHTFRQDMGPDYRCLGIQLGGVLTHALSERMHLRLCPSL